MSSADQQVTHPSQSADALQLRLADVLDGYVAALERGETPSIEALAAQHPDLAALLPQYLEGVDWIHQAVVGNASRSLRPNAMPSGAESTQESAVDAQHEELRRLGDFQLQREVGRGGMGIVYEAVQISLQRRVALKVLPFAAVLDERQIARFRTEAQAAAGLHHPNIVPVFAIGQERGLHYYAMQYIAGQSLAQAVEELKQANQPSPPESASADTRDTTVATRAAQGLSTVRSIRESDHFRAVAELGVQAAAALEHAHQFGVVHRDIKPSNLMIDGEGKPWVADFGLARMQSEMSVTLPGDVVGTLRYMSPEQASGRSDLVDGRSDVYALGATLYELLTLSPAHPGEDHHALLDRINASEPTPLRKLNAAAPVDLETIILRAMEKNREDRYATAAEFAEDLQRFLDGKATLARRPNVLERSARFIARRRKTAVAVGLALAFTTAVAVACAVMVSAANQRTRQALAESQQSLALAESHYRQARQVVDHFGGSVADRLAELPGAEPLRQELLLDALGYYQRFLRSASADPDLGGDLAATHFKSAAIAERLGDPVAAQACYQQAVDQWRKLNEASASEAIRGSLALGLSCLARTHAAGGDTHRADQLFAEAIALQRDLLSSEPNDADRARALAETLCNYGLAKRRAGDQQPGVDLMRRGVALYEQAFEASVDNAELMRDLAVAQNNLSEAVKRESLPEAFAASRAAHATLRRLTDLEPSDPQYLADFAMSNNNLAALEGARGNWREAADLYQDAAEQIGRLVDFNPLIPRHRRELAIARSNLGLALIRLGDLDAGNAALDAAEEVLARLAADYPQQSIYASSLAALWNNRGVALRNAGMDQAATEAFARSVEQQEVALTGGEASPRQLAALDQQYKNYADALRQADRKADAESIEQKRQELAGRSSPPAGR